MCPAKMHDGNCDMNKKWIGIALGVLVLAVAFLINRKESDMKQKSDLGQNAHVQEPEADENRLTPALTNSSSKRDSDPPKLGFSAQTNLPFRTTNDGVVWMFGTSVGWLSATEIQSYVDALVHFPDFDSGVERLLASTSEQEAVFGVYLWLGKYGYIESSALNIVDNATTPHVPAEIARWLLANNQIEDLDAFLILMASRIIPVEIYTLTGFYSKTPNRLDVPAFLSVLGVGSGYDVYYRELALRSPNLTKATLDAVQDSHIDANTRLKFVDLLSYLNPNDIEAVYVSVVNDESASKLVRESALHHLCARIESENDLPQYLSPNVIENVKPFLLSMQYHSQCTGQISAVEEDIKQMIKNTNTPNPSLYYMLLLKYQTMTQFAGIHVDKGLAESIAQYSDVNQLALPKNVEADLRLRSLENVSKNKRK